MAPVTDIMAVHATRTRFAHPLAVLTFHLLRLVKVFEIGATDQAAGWRGHVGVLESTHIIVRVRQGEGILLIDERVLFIRKESNNIGINAH